MAAYRRVYDSRHLHADCQEPGSAPEPYARLSSMGYLYIFLPFIEPFMKLSYKLHCFASQATSVETVRWLLTLCRCYQIFVVNARVMFASSAVVECLL